MKARFEVLCLNHWQEHWSQGKQTHHLIELNKACSCGFRGFDGYRFKTDGLKAWIILDPGILYVILCNKMLNMVPWTWQSIDTAPQPAAIWLLSTPNPS